MTVKAWIAARYIARRLPKEARTMFGKSWKTSLAGVGAILAGLAALLKCFADGQVSTECIITALGMISGGVGLLMAKDAQVTGGATSQPTVANPPTLTEVKP